MTNTPEQYLAEAKEKAARLLGLDSWDDFSEQAAGKHLGTACILALQAQAEDYEKERKELNLMIWNEDIDQLKAELEKAKQLCTESQLSIHGLVQVMNGSYELKDRYMKAVDLVDKLNGFLTPTGDEGQNR